MLQVLPDSLRRRTISSIIDNPKNRHKPACVARIRACRSGNESGAELLM